jgi:hypothetical protein
MRVLDLRKYLKGDLINIRMTEGHNIYTVTYTDKMGTTVSIVFSKDMLLQLVNIMEDLWDGDWEWEEEEEDIKVGDEDEDREERE